MLDKSLRCLRQVGEEESMILSGYAGKEKTSSRN